MSTDEEQGPLAGMRVIELGESNDQFVEVLSGLDQDDRVLLSDPGTSAVTPQPAATPRLELREGGRALQPR